MNEEEKDLLLKDICARLPYNDLLVRYNGYDYNIISIGFGRVTLVKPFMSFTGPSPLIEEVKPYLRPMSSMTEEEKKKWHRLIVDTQDVEGQSATTLVNDWYLSKNFDVRGLIEKGLALEAPEDMYKKKGE